MAEIWMDVDTALAEVPVNIAPLTDDTDFKSREVAIAYNQAGMDLVWNFVTTAGAYTQTAVTPTTSGTYAWAHQGDGMYSIEIPASGGASINNDTEGYGWFTGFCTGVLPWRGPIIGFRASGLNDKLIDSAYDTTRGLAGTALPAAAAEAAGGLYTRGSGAGQINQANNGQVDANAARTGGTTNTGRDIGASVLLSPGTGTGQISLSSGTVTVGTNNDKTGYTASTVSDKTGYALSSAGVQAIWDALSSALTTANSIGKRIVDFLTGDIYTRLGAPAGASTAADIAAVKAKTDLIPASPAAVGSAMTLTSGERDSIAAALLDLSNGIETSITPRQAMRLILAANAGKLSGAATTTITIRNVGDSKTRITATVDADGNRSAVTVDAT